MSLKLSEMQAAAGATKKAMTALAKQLEATVEARIPSAYVCESIGVYTSMLAEPVSEPPGEDHVETVEASIQRAPVCESIGAYASMLAEASPEPRDGELNKSDLFVLMDAGALEFLNGGTGPNQGQLAIVQEIQSELLEIQSFRRSTEGPRSCHRDH